MNHEITYNLFSRKKLAPSSEATYSKSVTSLYLKMLFDRIAPPITIQYGMKILLILLLNHKFMSLPFRYV